MALNSFNIVRHLGRPKTAIDMRNGKTIERMEYLVVKLGEEIKILPQVDDLDHFCYNFVMPVSNEDLLTKYKGRLPLHLQGPTCACTCGSPAVTLIDGPMAYHIICEAFIKYGKHQTSFKVENGELQLDKKTKDNLYMLDSDMNKILKLEDDK